MSEQLSKYWNPAMETMPRESLKQLQLSKLRTQLSHAYRNAPFYHGLIDDAGFDPDRLESIEQYSESFPIIERSQLIEAQAKSPPFGDLAAVSPRHAFARHQTSGSSGQPPFRSFDTARDWTWSSDRFALGLYALGIRPGDQVAVAFGYGMFLGFWIGHYAIQRIGAVPISTGAFDSERRIRLLVEEDIAAFLCTPTYALRLAYVAQELGVDLGRDTNVRVVVTSGEARPPATRRAIEEAWGAHCGEVAGMTEAAFIMFECGPGSKGMHVIESDFIEEALDAETGEPVGYGEQGVRVLTSLGRESIPMFRYWTNDLIVRKPGSECDCGRTWDFYEGGILGRADDVCKVRGALVIPGVLEDVLRSFPEVDEFQSVVETVDALDTLLISVEPLGDVDDERQSSLADEIRDEIKRAVGITPQVTLAETGSLPRFELKAKRFRDTRQNTAAAR